MYKDSGTTKLMK